MTIAENILWILPMSHLVKLYLHAIISLLPCWQERLKFSRLPKRPKVSQVGVRQTHSHTAEWLNTLLKSQDGGLG